ncbi:unnamed protein product [Rotaria sp. Silwood2]|nr:unnamed protein product [Rotaria sp. Silwood2]CAF3958723.1 unnamed protein product [Rotaria sp. Silwood2]CAF4066549.1 unnamed protein product [Rotaria sp. Silwood2]
MMHYRPFSATVFLLCLATTLSLRCYRGTGDNVSLQNELDYCTTNNPCSCVTFRFTCSEGDSDCTSAEQATEAKKWGYAILPKTLCEFFANDMWNDGTYFCCEQDACNRPKTGKRSWFRARDQA